MSGTDAYVCIRALPVVVVQVTGDVGDEEFMAKVQELVMDLQNENDKLKITNAELEKGEGSRSVIPPVHEPHL
eukprot:34694-Eustigmatos_ZCMA.PRE.1